MRRIELLTVDHDIASFDCGDDAKNRFLQRFALQNTKGGLGRTYVAVNSEDPLRLLGFYTILSSSLKFDNPPSHLPRYPLPAILIGKLAVDLAEQGKGLGRGLLFDALERATRVANEIGIFLVEIQAVDEKAKAMYEKFGFIPTESEPMKLFMNLKTVRKIIGSQS